MNPFTATILPFLIAVVLFCSRRWALLAMMAGVLYLTQYQTVLVAGFNLPPTRFLEIAGCLRVLSRREFALSSFNTIDRALLVLFGYNTIVFLLRSSDGFAYIIGQAVDALLCYVIFRGLVRDCVEFRWFLRSFVLLLLPYIFLLAIERSTGLNPFALLGGSAPGMARNGVPRCCAAFRHPSLLGTLGASFLPLYAGLAFDKINRNRACLGIALCCLIVWFTNSGGPIGAAAAAAVGWLLWFFRERMRSVRWSIVGLVVLAALFMKAPIWYLPAKLSSLTGGDGWHRSYLIDVAMRHFGDWGLAGMPIENTSDWFPYLLEVTGGADMTNAYLLFGITSGVVTIILFIRLLTVAFSNLGRALASFRVNFVNSQGEEPLLWGLGVMLAVHIVNWFGMAYWDQTYILWYLQLALISTLSQAVLAREPAAETEIPDSSAEAEAASAAVGFTGAAPGATTTMSTVVQPPPAP